MKTGNVDVLVVGAGPAGLAAAVSAHDSGAQVLLLEREARLGGTLKQCIHDGFGLQCFGEQLSGPEYAERYIDELHVRGIEAHTLTFVTKVGRSEGGYAVHAVSRDGISVWNAKALVLATGCRQRTARQVFIHGTRPAGVFTAGTAQHFVNRLGLMPGKRCVILGSGDTGLIMARRLTLEGAEVLGVYEAKAKPSGLTRNLHQCLYDYGIPLYLSHTVTRIFGVDRVEAVEISEVDENMVPIAGTARRLDCDTLILSVGLIPENELAQSIGVQLDARTGGPVCDGQCMTSEDGVFSCGNALHVNDLVDHVSQNAELAGKAAAQYAAEPKPRMLIDVVPGEGLQYVVPQRLNLNESNKATKVYFRVREEEKNCTLHITADGKEILQKQYPFVRPPEMGILTVDFDGCALNENSRVELRLECGNRKGDDAK